MPPHALHRVRMTPSTHTNESDRVVECLVYVAMRFYVRVCRPVVTDDCSAGFDPVTKNIHQSVDGCVWNGN